MKGVNTHAITLVRTMVTYNEVHNSAQEVLLLCFKTT